jgi:hypothetical protein
MPRQTSWAGSVTALEITLLTFQSHFLRFPNLLWRHHGRDTVTTLHSFENT